VTDLDDAIRLLRQAIFGLERRLDAGGLRQQVLHLCAGLSPVPEITFTGPVDDCLPGPAIDRLLGMLRMACGLIRPGAEHTSVDLRAAETLIVVVTGTGPGQRSADGSGPDFSPLKDEASLAGTAIEIGTVPGVTRLAWSLPVRSGTRLTV
jgi:hypothetical protein